MTPNEPVPQEKLGPAQLSASNRAGYSFLSHSLPLSLVCSIAFFLIFMLVFRPGYAVNDDFGIISLASGYLGGQPVPFLMFSNVLLGFLLNSLYELHTRINWLIILSLAVNFLSIFTLLHLIFSAHLRRYQKLFAALAVLVCDTNFLMNITFTTTAAFASLTGLVLVVSAAQPQVPPKKGLVIWGSALALIGSLIRIESWLSVMILIIPPLVLGNRYFKLRRLAIALVIPTVLVFGCYAFDRSYLRASPGWHAFDVYNQTRSMVQDTPRLTNLGATIKAIGWNENDLVMFTHWFIPDAQVYSLEHLHFLVDTVSDKRGILSAFAYALRNLLSPVAIPYILILVSTWLGVWLYVPDKRVALPLLVLDVDLLSVVLFLAWTQKLPDRVLLPLLAAAAIFGLFILSWMGTNQGELESPANRKNPFYWVVISGIFMSLVVAIGLVVGQSIQTTRLNIAKQAAYHQILSDIEGLVAQGKLPANALIASNATGIPFEWSDPMVLEFPAVQYLDMGWLTNSPAYDQALHINGVQSLPAGLYQNSNVYLMTRESVMYGILQFIRDHENIEVSANRIYKMPNSSGDVQYDNIYIFKLEQKN